MSKLCIAIIGGGNMGEAFIKGLSGHTIIVCEADPKKAAQLKKKYKVTVTSIPEAFVDASVVILAVKPQDMQPVLELGGSGRKGQLFISIAAGLTTKFFEKHLGKIQLVRAMPNMPAFIGEGITGVCGGTYAASADIKLAQQILASIGDTVVVKEDMMDAITAVSGSGPAYVFLFVEQWIAAAKTLGFNDAQAKALVYKTLTGSAHLLEQSEFDAGTLRAKVTSKGGTTQAALDVFNKAQFSKTIKHALAAAKRRAKELAK